MCWFQLQKPHNHLRTQGHKHWRGRGSASPHPPVFGRSLIPIPTGEQIMPTILFYYSPPDCQTFLRPWNYMSKMKNEQRSKSFNLEVGIGCKSQIVLKSGWSVLNWASKGKKKEAKSLSKAETNEVHWFVDLYQGYLLWPIYPIEPSMAIELQFWEATKIPRPFCNHCSPQSRKPIRPSYASNSDSCCNCTEFEIRVYLVKESFNSPLIWNLIQIDMLNKFTINFSLKQMVL